MAYPDTPSMLRPLIKAPMVFILGLSGCMVGISMTSIKFASEIIAAGLFSEDPGLVVTFFAIVTFNSIFLLFSVNVSMKYYD